MNIISLSKYKFMVYKDWLYYVDNDANILYRYNMDNHKLTAVCNDDMSLTYIN